MLSLIKTIHVLALGLWFGSSVFFSFFVALTIFRTFESVGAMPAANRPAWLPLPLDLDREGGSRLAGLAVGSIFPWYFLLQGVCGLLAAFTALLLSRIEPKRRLHGIRTLILMIALTTVLIGWPLSHKVSELRMLRYAADQSVAVAAQTDFARWHFYSLMLNFVTMGLVMAAMCLAAHLPCASNQEPK